MTIDDTPTDVHNIQACEATPTDVHLLLFYLFIYPLSCNQSH